MERSPVGQRFERGWFFTDLPGYRDHPDRFTTYSLFSHADLPPIDEDLRDFAWLLENPAKERSLLEGMYPNGSKPDLSRLGDLQASCPARFPPAFIEFMRSAELQGRVRSNTDCYLDLGDFVTELPGAEPRYLVHFLSDSQWILHWYLWLDSSGNHCVLTSLEGYCFLSVDLGAPEGAEADGLLRRDLDLSSLLYCGDHFVEFLYRFWLENEIWYSLAFDDKPLTDRQRRYVEHYRGGHRGAGPAT